MNRLLKGSLLTIIFAAILVCLYVGNPSFVDENDNFLGGMFVADVGDVYKAYFSQHMPIAYYLSAFFRKLGANSIVSFRIFSYCFLSVLWGMMYYRYGRLFDGKALAFYCFGYVAMMSNFFPIMCNASVLSDMWQAQAMVIFMLEYLLFCERKEISRDSILWLSLAMLLSIGTAFISVFSTFVIFVGVVLKIIYEAKKSDEECFFIMLNDFKKMAVTLFIVFVPFFVLGVWYFFTDNLDNFIYQSYTFNREIYSKYVGIGDSVLDLIKMTILNYAYFPVKCVSMIHNKEISGVILLVYICFNYIFLFTQRKDIIKFMTLFAFILMTGTRAFVSYVHGAPYYAVSIMMGSLLLFDSKKSIRKSALAAIFVGIILFLPCAYNIETLLNNSNKYISGSDFFGETSLLKKVMQDTDKYYISNFDIGIAVELNKVPINQSIPSAPWMYEEYKTYLLHVIDTEKPKFIIYDKNNTVALNKYYMKDYAKEFTKLIDDNYTMLTPLSKNIYVRNEFANDIRKTFGYYPLSLDLGNSSGNIVVLGMGKVLKQRFVAVDNMITQVGIPIGTYNRINNSQLFITLHNVSKNKMGKHYSFNLDEAKNDTYNYYEINEPTIPGDIYELEITNNGNANNSIAIYTTDEKSKYNNGYAIFNGIKQPYNLALILCRGNE